MSRIDLDAFEDDWEDAEQPVAPRNRKLSAAARRRIADLATGQVVAVDRGRVTVVVDGRPVEAALAGTMRRTKAIVGDVVRLRGDTTHHGGVRVVEVLPRESVLLRTGDDAEADARPVVANADQVVVVVAADHLDAGVRFLDRVMVAAAAGHMQAVLCINKIDLTDENKPVAQVRADYGAIGVTSVATSARTQEGIGELKEILRNRWSAFAGHSGVGKSSLFNVLAPQAQQVVGEMGRYGGRHTTVASRALPLHGGDGWIVDTPGVRSFGLGMVDLWSLPRYFPELAPLVCQLDDCLHDGEPGCTLAQAQITPQRLASYRRLLAALRERR